MEAANKNYLVKINELFTEKDALELALKANRNIALLAATRLRRENCLLRAQNHHMKEEVTQAFNDAKEAWTRSLIPPSPGM